MEIASETLWRLTAGRYGVCGEITRPCATPCEPPTSWGVGGAWMTPSLIAGQIVNNACACPGPACSCGPIEQVELGAPVVEVTAVMIDGEQLPASAYVVHNDRWLVRTDGGTWPACQHMDRALDQPGTFGVAYWRGRYPPASAARIMGVLVCELIKQCAGDGDCRPTATRVEREGLSYEIWRPEDPNEAAALLPEVSSWLARLGLADQRSPGSVWSPDFPVLRTERTWPAVMRMAWEPHPTEPLAIQVTVSGVGSTGAVVDFGDGSSQRVEDNQPVTHLYSEAGTYVVTACTPGRRQCLNRTVVVKAHDVAEMVHLFRHADNPWWLLAWVDDQDPTSRYLIEWGDGHKDQVYGLRSPPHPRLRHDYQRSGTYQVRITDLDTRRSTTRSYTTGDIGVVFSYPSSSSRPRLAAMWIARNAVWEVDWGTLGTDRGTMGPECRLDLLYGADMPAGIHTIAVSEYPAEADYELRRRSVRQIRIPTDWEWGLDVYMLWRDHRDEPGRQTVDITPRDAKRACMVDWGDGSPPVQVQPEGTVTHTYFLPVPDAGYRLTVTEPGDEQDTERIFSRLMAQPRHVAEPVLSTRKPGAVDLDVAGAAGESNADWYWIDWGDGTIAPFGAVGSGFPAHHTYQAEGDYMIVLDGPGMPEAVRRRIRVRFYPSPDMQIREYRTEQPNGDADADVGDRRTVEVRIDNTEPDHCGGDVRMRWGDNTGNTILAEDAVHTHTFPDTGQESDSYEVIAACLKDLTAKTRETVTVPFGPPSTLDVRFSRPDPADAYTVRCTVVEAKLDAGVQVSWGDGGGSQQIPPAGYLEHVYANPSRPDPDWYYPRASYLDGSEGMDGMVEIPWPPTDEAPR